MTSLQIQQLNQVFNKFCAFGRGSSESLDQTMDGQKFAKFARDSGIIDKVISSTEIDIVFNKVKPKTERRINFQMFQDALAQIAYKKYHSSSQDEAFSKIITLVTKVQTPSVNATAVKNDAVLGRLTDVSAYTGTHKNRFSQDGKGLGLSGRETHAQTAQLSQLVDRTKRPNVLTQSEEKLEKSTTKIVKPVDEKKSYIPVSRTSLGNSNASLPKSSINSNASLNGKAPAVFDRLTNVNGYTGSHKHRFNNDGTGRGAAGRDLPAKGNGHMPYKGGDVKSLSQILRN